MQAPARPVVDEETMKRMVEFHGHLCPGLSMGVLAAAIALREVGPNSRDEQVIAVIETDMCGVDAIQYLTSCTYGKGNLIHRDWGKKVYTFYRRSDRKAVRVAARPGAFPPGPEQQELRAKIDAGQATDADHARMRELRNEQSWALLDRDPYDFYTVSEFTADPPERDRTKESVPCDDCGEEAKSTRVLTRDDRQLCRPCFDAHPG